MNYRNKTILLILFATLIRCAIAATTELGNDEVYYWVYSTHLQWNYFDHPPMVAWLIRLSTFNLFFSSEFFIRSGAIISSAIVTWIIYNCGKKLIGEYTGFLAASIYTATIYGSIVAGTFILPDSPQMIFWAASLYLLINITASESIDAKKIKDLLWFGILTGLGMLCKIHTAFLWIGFMLYIIFYNRLWLKKTALYISILITTLLFTPIIIWNINNHFITFTYHSNRVFFFHDGINLNNFFSFIVGQLLYCNPVIFFSIIISLLHNKYSIPSSQKRLLLLTGFPLILILGIISFFKEVLPHWTGPAYTGFILLTAVYFTDQKKKKQITKNPIPLSISIATILLLVVISVGIIVINFFPGTIGNKGIDKKGDGDFTLDMYGWKKFANSFDSIYYSTHTIHDNNIETIILVNKWFPAAHIEHYVAWPLHINVFAEGSIDDIHQYYWLNKQRDKIKDSTEIYLIVPSNYFFDIRSFAPVKDLQPEKTIIIHQYRNNIEARNFKVYYFKPGKYTLLK